MTDALIFNGDILQKYAVGVLDNEVPDEHWVNFLGLATKADWFPGGNNLAGRFISSVPIPDDGAYGGAAEYISMLTAIDSRMGELSKFTAIELGAGWGPWISAVGVTCKRLGFKDINLVGVEAEKTKVSHMADHLATNGLLGDPVHARIIHGAAWSEDTMLYFPTDMPMTDYGGAAATEQKIEDYRGFQYKTIETPAYSLETICTGLDVIDYAHWDVQGAEWPIAANARDLLDAKVRHLFIGTHSRRIEGNLINLFFSMGWDVLFEEPSRFTYDRNKTCLEAMNYSDGGLFLRNPKLLT